MQQYVCIDIGGTEIKYGVLDENELFLTKDKMPTEAFKGGPSLLEKKWMAAGDTFAVGGAQLRFVPLCGPEFNWNAAPKERK